MKPTRPSSPGGGSAGDPSRPNHSASLRSSLRFGRNTPGPVLPVGAPPSRALSAGPPPGELADLGPHVSFTTGHVPVRNTAHGNAVQSWAREPIGRGNQTDALPSELHARPQTGHGLPCPVTSISDFRASHRAATAPASRPRRTERREPVHYALPPASPTCDRSPVQHRLRQRGQRACRCLRRRATGRADGWVPRQSA